MSLLVAIFPPWHHLLELIPFESDFVTLLNKIWLNIGSIKLHLALKDR